MEQPPMDDKDATVREKVGYIWVDSGQLVLTDPMYLEELDPDMLAATTNLNHRAHLVNEGMAAAFRSGLRNAKYPVYVTRFRNGALARIEVVMDERFETDGG